MQRYPITLACRNYDRTSAILRDVVTPPEVDLRTVEMTSVPAMVSAMFKGEYDVSEMSLAELVYYTSRGENPFLGIPVFPYRLFRHGFIFHNAAAGIRRTPSASATVMPIYPATRFATRPGSRRVLPRVPHRAARHR